MAAALLVAFLVARVTSIYLATPAWTQTDALQDLHPGTAGLRVDGNTRAFYEDFHAARALAGNLSYAILPDMAAWWATSQQPNPLLLDWPNDTELMDPGVLERFLADLDSHRGSTAFLVSKVQTSLVSYAVSPRTYELAAGHVEAEFELVGETAFFRVYR